MDIRKQLLTRIEEFLGTRKMTETTFGLKAVNDGKFVGRLRANRNITVDTLDKVNAYLDRASRARESEATAPQAVTGAEAA